MGKGDGVSLMSPCRASCYALAGDMGAESMDETASNAARVAAAYRHWHDCLGSDPEPFFAMADEGIEMGSVLNPPEFNPLAEDRSGIERMRDYFVALAAEWAMVEFPTEQIIEQGDTVVWIGSCTWRNRHTGVVVSTPKIDVWTFRQGRAVRIFEMFDTLGFARGMGIMLAPPPAG